MAHDFFCLLEPQYFASFENEKVNPRGKNGPSCDDN
jgi:hypothetical protein